VLKIYIARHGQDEDNASGTLNGHRDMPLTAKGREQAQFLGKEIVQMGLKFDAVFSSPLGRTLETARLAVAPSGNPEPVVMQELIERNFGIMTGEPVASIRERCSPDILQADPITYFLSPEGAETFPDMLARAGGVIADLKSRFADGSILIVTHGDFGKMLYAAYYGLDWKDVLLQFHFGNSELILLSEDSPATDVHVFKQTQFNH
jgi:probable phosphoglycerate mutase